MKYQYLDIRPGEKGVIHPELQAVYDGTNVAITCGSSDKPTWKKDGEPNWNPPQQTIFNGSLDILLLTLVTGRHSGIYICHGTKNSTDVVKKFAAESRLLVGSKFLNFCECNNSMKLSRGYVIL